MPYSSTSSPASSTATLFTTYASDKTVIPAQGKDYAAAFGDLQARHGLAAPGAPSAPLKPAKAQKGAWWKPHRDHKAETSASASQAPQISPSTSAHVPPKGKDYEAAFGQLQAGYGLGPGVPTRKSPQCAKSPQHIRWHG